MNLFPAWRLLYTRYLCHRRFFSYISTLLSIKRYIWLEQCGKGTLEIHQCEYKTHKNRIHHINYASLSLREESEEKKIARVPLVSFFQHYRRAKMSAYKQFITKNHTHATLVSVKENEIAEMSCLGERWRENEKERQKMPSQPHIIKNANWTEHLNRFHRHS